MRSIYLHIFLFSSLSLSCIKQNESITPLVKPQTIAEIQQEALLNLATMAGNSELSNEAKTTLEMSSDPSVFYLNIKYNLKDIDIFKMTDSPNLFEQIGNSFLQSMAKILLSISGPRAIEIDDFDLQIPDIEIDHSLVKSIKIKKIFFQYNNELDAQGDYLANFSFIDTLELSREMNVPKLGKVYSLFISYRKIHNKCLYKCIQFDILESDILKIIKPKSKISLRPHLAIGKLPETTELRLDGSIEMQIGLKMPF